ncbi:MAG: hypothetical protein CBE00_13005 [Planctomycetaceae bacterium TMED240]|nr:hypothetical protein [Rhodopirellula sp.]OUX04254.1 MAG: hypothetical protein CBE00_13005 [Planctomycetaceae bacterium TMED240]
MKLSKLALIAAIACGTYAGNVFADQTNDIQLVACESDCDCGEPVCGCEPGCDEDACDDGCDSAGCGLDIGNGRVRNRIGDMLSIGDCCLGEPWQLFGNYRRVSVGGWGQLGYQSRQQSFGGPPSPSQLGATEGFNDYPDHLQLQQGWIFAEKAIDSSCGLDIGGRVDFIYGTDGQDLQANGNFDEEFDQDWDNGSFYGSALPQLYLEVGYGDVSVKVGRMLLNAGYESAMSPNNFFYSHSYAFNNIQPYTGTGAIATYSGLENISISAGFIEGLNTGFDSNGDTLVASVGLDLTDRLDVQYNVVGGRLLNFAGGPSSVKGAIHSIVAAYDLRCDLQYAMEATIADYDDGGNDLGPAAGISNYFIKTMNECNSVGLRYEWLGQEWDGIKGDFHELTLGWNHRRSANLIIRPEVRWDWINIDDGADEDDHASFAVDAIMTF